MDKAMSGLARDLPHAARVDPAERADIRAIPTSASPFGFCPPGLADRSDDRLEERTGEDRTWAR
jgi:hypothetical protein